MNINRKIQILIILVILAIAIAAIGISANNIINEKSQYQQNGQCTYSEECPQPYCNYEQQLIKNYQPSSCCGRRT